MKKGRFKPFAVKYMELLEEKYQEFLVDSKGGYQVWFLGCFFFKKGQVECFCVPAHRAVRGFIREYDYEEEEGQRGEDPSNI